MNYQEYFDSLVDEDLYENRNKVLEILENEYENDNVRGYTGLDEMVFEFLLALEERNDIDSILSLKKVLEEYYEEVYESEYGQFADILIPIYIAEEEAKAKLLFDKWIEKEYDYDSILITLNRLIYFGKENWIEAFITKEYSQIKNSPKLIEGAEMELSVYKFMIELGKYYSGQRSLEEIKSEFSKYEIMLSAPLQELVVPDNFEYTNAYFKRDRSIYFRNLAHSFQQYLNEVQEVPYLTSAMIMESLEGYYENSKYHDHTTYFKLRENAFQSYMKENTYNGMSFNIESNFAMLYILPVLYQFLADNGIFTEEDRHKEGKKVEKMLEYYKLDHPKTAKVFDSLQIYNKKL